mmetsp:Transcript_7020/g.10346  ORF Transcript_7020/g.10346 Transcript_7020/m.10346 type:complete len:153 (-) Transcript_7020:455-913(-)|eukprot:3839368-Ditylum_brightwellii.AAC.1
MMPVPTRAILFLSAFLCNPLFTTALSTVKQQQFNRRDALSSIFTIGVGSTAFLPVATAYAAEDNQALTDEEMAARIARKMELLKAQKANSGGPARGLATDIRSDVNPDAAANLRSRSAIENAKIAMEKQKEIKNRGNTQKREDLCEMLGRGC